MKNLKEIWSGIRLDAELIKQNYNAELLGIGVHGMTRLAVKLEDADLEFIQGSLKELYVSENDKDYTVRSFVRFTEKNEEGKYGTYYMVKIEHLRDSDNFRFTLQTGGPDPNKKKRLGVDMFECTSTETKNIRSWKSVLSGFSCLV